MESLETQHHKDTRDLGDPVMSTNLVFYTKATSAVPASAWTPPPMRGSLLYWATVTIREFFLILSQALPFVTSTLWNHSPYEHPFSIWHSFLQLFKFLLKTKSGWNLCCSFATGNCLSHFPESPHPRICPTSRFPKRKQGYEHFLQFPFSFL